MFLCLLTQVVIRLNKESKKTTEDISSCIEQLDLNDGSQLIAKIKDGWLLVVKQTDSSLKYR